ncbi:Sugar transporter, partial [Operophtera brumata]
MYVKPASINTQHGSGAVSYPTVLLHQLKAKDSPIQLDFNTASWIGAIHGLAGIPSILMPTIMQWRGRKFSFIAACLVSIAGWILAYTAKTATVILISESFHGLGSNSIYAVTCLSITEMMAPEHRDTFIQLYYIFLSMTMAINGLLTQYLHWKTISIIMCVPMILALLIACAWPESPYWLAYKGEYGKCEQAFRWLRGTDALSKKELQEIINTQRGNVTARKTKNVKYFWNTITSRDFYIPCVHVFVLEFLVQGIGCIILLIYSIELFQKATGNNSIAFFGGFIVNVIQLLGVVLSIVLNRYFKKNTILLGSIFGAVVALLSASFVSYLQSVGTLSSESLACLFCLIIYMISTSIGVIPVAYPVASALMPVKHRGIGGVFYVTNTCLLHTLALKLAPYLFIYIHLYGTFILFAMNGVICGLVIWKFIPETKGKTLQEIENYYVYGKFNTNRNEHDQNNECWILTYTAKTSTAILVSESFHGLGSSITCLSMTEMIAPRHRDALIQMFHVTEFITMALTGLMVQFLYWKTIGIILCVPMILALLTACMWPESPYWLAYKGELGKCEQAFILLRGTDTNSKKELKELIHIQKERLSEAKTTNTTSLNNFWYKITSADFYVPCVHIFVLEYLVHGTGCLVIVIYSIELIQKATSNESIVFLGSFIVNVILLIGFVSTIAINKYFNKKTVLLSSILGATGSLVSASAVSYLQSSGILSEESLLCFFCLAVYLISISLGIMSVAYPIASALMPVKHRGIGGILYVTNTCVFHTLALKLAPYLFLYIHLWGTFLLFAANGICCGLIIWKFIPETAGRTLQEIEDFYTYGKFIARNLLLQQLRSNETTIELDFDTASWIGSINGLAGIPSILMPTVMQWKGRRFAFIAACLIIIAGWVFSYTATSVAFLLISESLHGLGANSILAVSLLSMSEMITPKYRNISMLSFSIIQALGMGLVGIMATCLHWKTISLIMCTPMIMALITACTWPESPSWLAYKGKFDKCEKAFTWLRGTDDLSKKELNELINAQKDILSTDKCNAISFKVLFRKVLRKDFYLPSIHMFVVLNLMYWSGVMVVLIYSSQLIEKATQNKSAARFGGIAMNSMLFTFFTITGVLVRRFDNKPVLLISAFSTSICLLSACIVTYLQSIGTLPKDSLLFLYCLIAYIVCSSLGMNSIVFTIAAELMPVKHRGIGGALFVIYTCLLHTSSLKLSPYMFLYIDLWGTFLVYTINAMLCGLFIWKYVPETKGRTLQEIEDFYVYG